MDKREKSSEKGDPDEDEEDLQDDECIQKNSQGRRREESPP